MATPARSDQPGLPAALTPLIGREREVAATAHLLSRSGVRLVTLTGPGGVGKTRLALAAATETADAFPDGIWFVGLAPITDPELVAPAIAKVLDVREAGDTPLTDRIVASLRGCSALLLLDNFEQVVDAAPLAADLLRRCPGLKVLVTSRVRLRLSGEYERSVPPLELAGPEADTAEGAERSEAVRLFVQRARAVKNDFVLERNNAQAVANICRRLDGLPLAIELAAARIKVLPPSALLARMERRLPLLTGGGRDLPARQQTMRDTIAWSYDLLPTEEQSLFRRLSVFVGGFTLEAADAIGRESAGGTREPDGLAPDSPITVLDGIASLVDASLLRAVADADGEPRYLMLETVREFGLERLDARGETETTRDAHAAYFLTYAERAAPDFLASVHREWLDRLDADHDNLRAAFERLCRPDTIEACLRLGSACGHFWLTRGHIREGRERLGGALSVASPLQTRAKGTALHWAAELAFTAGDPLATAGFEREALAVWEVVGNARGRAAALHGLACVEEIHLNLEAARPLFEAEIVLWRELDEPRSVATAQMLLSGVVFGQGDVGRAVALAEEAAAGFRELGDRGWLATVEWYLGLFAAADGQLACAARRYRDSLIGFAEAGDVSILFKPLVGLAAVAIEVGLPDTAARFLGAADELTARTGAALLPFDLPAYERARAGARNLLGETAFTARHRTGSTLGPAELLAEADAVVATAEATPSPLSRSGPRPPTDLSPRELDVLRLVAEGKTDAAIASALFLSRRTVNAHVANILGKLGVPTRGDAVARARVLGLLDGVPKSTRYT